MEYDDDIAMVKRLIADHWWHMHTSSYTGERVYTTTIHSQVKLLNTTHLQEPFDPVLQSPH